MQANVQSQLQCFPFNLSKNNRNETSKAPQSMRLSMVPSTCYMQKPEQKRKAGLGILEGSHFWKARRTPGKEGLEDPCWPISRQNFCSNSVEQPVQGLGITV